MRLADTKQSPKQSFVEGQGQPNDHCAVAAGCPMHKMNDHMQKDEKNHTITSTANKQAHYDAKHEHDSQKHQRSDDAVRPPSDDISQTRVLDALVGSTYNE
jgi:hypothetical protein